MIAQEVDLDTIDQAIGGNGLTAWDWATAGIIVVTSIVLGRVARLVLGRVVAGRSGAAVADLIGRLLGYVIVVVGLVYGLERLDVRVGPLLGGLGIAGIALAFALKDILENFVAGLLLQLRRPFSYGDEILTGEIEGTVRSIDARSVTVETPDGEMALLPSSRVITDVIVNHTARGRRRTTLELGVAYGTDLPRARALLCDAVAGAEGVLDAPRPEVLVVGFGESSVDLVVRFWHGPTIAEHWRVRNEVALALDAACTEHDITIPFPQVVVWPSPTGAAAGDAATSEPADLDR